MTSDFESWLDVHADGAEDPPELLRLLAEYLQNRDNEAKEKLRHEMVPVAALEEANRIIEEKSVELMRCRGEMERGARLGTMPHDDLRDEIDRLKASVVRIEDQKNVACGWVVELQAEVRELERSCRDLGSSII